MEDTQQEPCACSVSCEPRFTLYEAERELERLGCLHNGHSFDVVTIYGSNDPQQILCSHCGESWKVDTRA